MEAHSPPDVSGTNSASKRKSDGEQPRSRAKRNSNECKRRKIKCNGQAPCQRCGNLNLDCVYAPNCCNNFKESDEFQQMTTEINTLQQQVRNLFSSVGTLTRQLESSSVTQAHSLSVTSPITTASHNPAAGSSRYHGATSATYNIGLARNSLQNSYGIADIDDIYADPSPASDTLRLHHPVRHESPVRTPPPVHTMPPRPVNEFKDVMWAVSKEEAIRLVNFWRDNINIMYPLVNIDQMMKHIDTLYAYMLQSRGTGPLMNGELSGAPGISDDDTIKLKLLLANAATLEGSGTSDIGEQLFASVVPAIESLMMRPPHLKCVEQLVLAAFFYFHRDDDTMAWRLWGMAGRMCFELGWHQPGELELAGSAPSDMYRICCLFWSIYVLDRRWSFATGLPFVIQEDDINPMSLKPHGVPYLNNMVELTGIASKVWPRARGTEFDIKELSYLDYQVELWQRNLPDDLRFNTALPLAESMAIDSSTARLRIILYFRGNQTRILIGRAVLLSTQAILTHLDFASGVVDVARETIRMLSAMHRMTQLYARQQLLYNYFLVSALTAVFLAVAHAPAHFSAACRDEFHLALDLVRGLSTNSFVGKRLWKTIRVLKELGPKLGLNGHAASSSSAAGNGAGGGIMGGGILSATGDQGDAHSNAAVAMAGLASGHVPMGTATVGNSGLKFSGFGIGFNMLPLSEGSGNWDIMADDLTNLYQAAEQNGPMGADMGVDGSGLRPRVEDERTDGDMLFSSGQEQLSKIFRDLF